MKGMKPSSSSGSHSSFMRFLHSSLVSFSPENGIDLLKKRQAILLFLNFFTEVGEETEELLAEDGVVLVLVVELEDLHEVVDATGVLGLLGGLEQGVEVVNL